MMDNIKKVIIYAREILKAQRPQRWPEVEALINQAEMDAQHYEWEIASAERRGYELAREQAEKVAGSVNNSSGYERTHNLPGGDAMGAVIEYRDRIRAMQFPEPQP